MRRLFILAVPMLLLACVDLASHARQVDVGPFPPVQAAGIDELDDAIGRARADGRLVLAVLGANWCHDSKALIDRMEEPALAALLAERYEVLLVNAGWLEQGSAIAARFGMVTYTHTPTVFIIDPQTGALINEHDHAMWRDASQVGAMMAVSYFREKAAGEGWTQPLAPMEGVYADRLAALDAMEAEQMLRIAAAYPVIGPRLRDRTDDLDEYWNPVRDLRYGLVDDLARLRQEVADQAAMGSADFAPLPEYQPFPWEPGGEEAASSARY